MEIAHVVWTRWRYAADLFCDRYGALQIREVPEMAGSKGFSEDDLTVVMEEISAGVVTE